MLGSRDCNQVYIIFPDLNTRPTSINSVNVYSDEQLLYETSAALVDDRIFVSLNGTDGDPAKVDAAIVEVSSSTSYPRGFRIILVETGLDTGTYIGNFTIKNRTNDLHRWIKATAGETVTVASVKDPSKKATILVKDIVIRPRSDKVIAYEDEPYLEEYTTEGEPLTEWQFDTNAEWLIWDGDCDALKGTPHNGHVGTYWVNLKAIATTGGSDERQFDIDVINRPPDIETEDVTEISQNEEYYVDYNSSDDLLGVITWHLDTNASWLMFDTTTGVLNGTPGNDDVGLYRVNVSVDDGNGGWNWSDFNLTVIDVNDPPVISTEDVLIAYEDELYQVDYTATDADAYDTVFKWSLLGNATWLVISEEYGILNGTPTNDDVGIYNVTVMVSDVSNGTDSHNFLLEVINTNDKPIWEDVPEDVELYGGDSLKFDVNATDVDVGDSLRYDLVTEPNTDLWINADSGVIEWMVSISKLKITTFPFLIKAQLSVTDGNLTASYGFNITILNSPPITTLLAPANRSIVKTMEPTLKWKGDDPEGDPLVYDVYLGEHLSDVMAMKEEDLVVGGITNISHDIVGLEKGSTYYWTVVPHDQWTRGRCTNGVFMFTVSDVAIMNNPPSIPQIPKQKTTVGKEFRMVIEGQDPDPWDLSNITYDLEHRPEGMAMDPVTGEMTWTPEKDQIGEHQVTVRISDGKLSSNSTFVIVVKKANKQTPGLNLDILLPVIMAIIIVVALVVILAFRRMRKGKGDRTMEHTEASPPSQPPLAETHSTPPQPTPILPPRPQYQDSGQTEYPTAQDPDQYPYQQNDQEVEYDPQYQQYQ
jgi:hypothetical protein